MSRLCPSAVQLIEDVTRINPKVKVQAVDPPDGLKRHRSIEFDARTSKWLVPVLEVIEDPRVSVIDYAGKGKATVTFVSDTRADKKGDFPLARVKRVLAGFDRQP